MIRLCEGDALLWLSKMNSSSIDLCFSDLPYGATQNSWDKIIPLDQMWAALHRVCKMNAALVFTATQPFAAQLITSNAKNFRYDLIWRKNKSTGFLNAKKQPLRIHEHLLVFYRAPPVYHPQMTNGHEPGHQATQSSASKNYGAQRPQSYGGSTERYPQSVLDIPIINNDDPEKVHPTQKPPALAEWVIKTYSNPGAIVLDITAGSGTTGLVAQQLNRHAVLVELNSAYCELIRKRLCLKN